MSSLDSFYRRRSIRLAGHDYSSAGWYFVTICTRDRLCWLGDIVDGNATLTAVGETIQAVWYDLPRRFPRVAIDEFVVMPNHVHGIVVMTGNDEPPHERAPGDRDERITLGEVIRTFKAVSARLVRSGGLPDFRWQRNYYEHIIRTERSLTTIRQYILDNPGRWENDQLYPGRRGWSRKRRVDRQGPNGRAQ